MFASPTALLSGAAAPRNTVVDARREQAAAEKTAATRPNAIGDGSGSRSDIDRSIGRRGPRLHRRVPKRRQIGAQCNAAGLRWLRASPLRTLRSEFGVDPLLASNLPSFNA